MHVNFHEKREIFYNYLFYKMNGKKRELKNSQKSKYDDYWA